MSPFENYTTGMLFPLAAIFLYPIISPADFMPIKTWIIWNLDQKLSGAWTFAHAHNGGDKRGCQSKNGIYQITEIGS
jgi:hypothetical protein